MSEDLISVKDAAAILGVDRAIVYREQKRGRLAIAKSTQQGKMNRSFFRRADVEQLRNLREQEVKS